MWYPRWGGTLIREPDGPTSASSIPEACAVASKRRVQVTLKFFWGYRHGPPFFGVWMAETAATGTHPSNNEAGR